MERIIKVKARVITPIFISGSNQKEAEMRAPSIKGILRFWFRAGFGEFSDKMIKKEEEIFGSKEKACVFQIRTSQANSDTFDRSSYKEYPGISYFLPFLEREEVIPEERDFYIRLRFFKDAKDKDIKVVLSSFWLLLWFGGIGTRARRGFGSLLLEHIEPEDIIQELNFKLQQRNINGLKNFLKENLKKAVELINPDESHLSGLPEYTLLNRQNTKIYLWKTPFNSWQEAIDNAGQLLMNWRNKKPPDYNEIRNFINKNKPPEKLKRPAFGLPIQFYYKSIENRHLSKSLFNLLKENQPTKSDHEIEKILEKILFRQRKNVKIPRKKKEVKAGLEKLGLDKKEIENLFKEARQLATAYVGGKRAKEGEYTRRSSPLFIKVIKLSDKNYALLFIFMKAELFPKEIKVEKEGGETFVEPPDFSMVEEFLEKEVKNKAYEIKLIW